jgi:hypothetical protein
MRAPVAVRSEFELRHLTELVSLFRQLIGSRSTRSTVVLPVLNLGHLVSSATGNHPVIFCRRHCSSLLHLRSSTGAIASSPSSSDHPHAFARYFAVVDAYCVDLFRAVSTCSSEPSSLSTLRSDMSL